MRTVEQIQHGRKACVPSSLCTALLVSLAIVLCGSTSTFAQSAKDLAATRAWLATKTTDRAVADSLRIGSSDPCDLKSGETGPYDPLPCLDSAKKQWVAMESVARNDPTAASVVKKSIRTIVEELDLAAKRWRAFSADQRTREIALRTEILREVQKDPTNVERGLQRLATDSKHSQLTQRTARSLLAVSNKQGGFGGPGGFLSCLFCVCVTAEGCPCCGYGAPLMW